MIIGYSDWPRSVERVEVVVDSAVANSKALLAETSKTMVLQTSSRGVGSSQKNSKLPYSDASLAPRDAFLAPLFKSLVPDFVTKQELDKKFKKGLHLLEISYILT